MLKVITFILFLVFAHSDKVYDVIVVGAGISGLRAS